MGHDLKTIRQAFKAKGVFYTDPELARMIASKIPAGVEEVYDPTCGDGALLAAFGDDVKKYGQELDPQQAELARANLVNCEIAAGDTLKHPAFAGRTFKAIVANPPFSIFWESDRHEDDPIMIDAPCLAPSSRADYAFMMHILWCLADDGVASVLEFPGVLYRGQREGKIREWMIRKNYIDEVIEIEPGHFVDTKVGTCLIVFRKNRKGTSVKFTDNKSGLSREVSFREIEDNDFRLSVSAYVQQPDTKEKLDPYELEKTAEEACIKHLVNSIKMSRFHAQQQGLSIMGFLTRLKEIIDISIEEEQRYEF